MGKKLGYNFNIIFDNYKINAQYNDYDSKLNNAFQLFVEKKSNTVG